MQKSITISLIVCFCLLAASVAGLVFIVQKLDPGAFANILYFYADLFLLSSTLTFLIGFSLRRWLGAREFTLSHYKISLRQSIWFGVLAVALFILLGSNLFTIWNALLLALSLAFLESFFLFK